MKKQHKKKEKNIYLFTLSGELQARNKQIAETTLVTILYDILEYRGLLPDNNSEFKVQLLEKRLNAKIRRR